VGSTDTGNGDGASAVPAVRVLYEPCDVQCSDDDWGATLVMKARKRCPVAWGQIPTDCKRGGTSED
jgi:hypothetical protein